MARGEHRVRSSCCAVTERILTPIDRFKSLQAPATDRRGGRQNPGTTDALRGRCRIRAIAARHGVIVMPDIDSRVALLENRLEDQTRMLQELRADMTAMRAAHTAETGMLLGAIRELRDETTDLRREMGRRFDALTADTNARFQQVDNRFQQIDSRFQQVDE